APRPARRAAVPAVEVLDEAPPQLTRPLALVEGHGYAASWLQVRRTFTESLSKTGEVVRHDPPRVAPSHALPPLADDGRLVGPPGDAPLEAPGVTGALPLVPPPHHLWRGRAVKAYRAGARPALAEVFRRLVASYDYHLDFAHSLGDQAQMCELGA